MISVIVGVNNELDALKGWKINIFKIIDTCISFYSRNSNILLKKLKYYFRHLGEVSKILFLSPKRGIQNFRMKYGLVSADKAANNVCCILASVLY